MHIYIYKNPGLGIHTHMTWFKNIISIFDVPIKAENIIVGSYNFMY